MSLYENIGWVHHIKIYRVVTLLWYFFMTFPLGLVVMLGNSCSRGHEFESHPQIHGWFLHFFLVRLYKSSKRPKRKGKEPVDGQFKVLSCGQFSTVENYNSKVVLNAAFSTTLAPWMHDLTAFIILSIGYLIPHRIANLCSMIVNYNSSARP